MQAYIYRADCYCPKCGEAIRAELTAAGNAPANPDDEHTYDSDFFPKGPYDDAGGTSDTIHHCGNGAKCLDPTIIDGENYGRFLENDLTTEGIRLLNEHIEEDPASPVVRFWWEWYRKNGYDAHLPPLS